MEWLTTNIGDIVTIGTALVTVASIIANHTATDYDNKAVGWLSKAINFLALNYTKLK